MYIVLCIFNFTHLETSKIWVENNFVGWDHPVGAQRYNSAIIRDHGNKKGKAVEFSKVFLLYVHFLTIWPLHHLWGVDMTFQNNLFMLACKTVIHGFDVRNEL